MMNLARREHTRSGFTLIELLVVIGIIGILAGMLLPSLSKARQQAQSANCVGSLRQWGLAMMLYLDDWDDRIPLDTDSSGADTPSWSTVGTSTSASAWYEVLPPYVKKLPVSAYSTDQTLFYKYGNIFHCPSVKWGSSPPIGGGRPQFSYAYNSKIIDGSHTLVRRRDLDNPPLDAGGANANHRAVNSTTVAMMLDTRASTAEPRAFPAESDTKVGSPHSYTKRLSKRHLDRINIAFFDGSVRSYQASLLMDSLGQNISTSPVIWSPWDPDAP